MAKHRIESVRARNALAVAVLSGLLLGPAGAAWADAPAKPGPSAQSAKDADHGHAEGEADHDETGKEEEGKVTLSAEQIAVAGIKVAIAAPATLARSAAFPGEIKFNADRTAHVVPRMAGVVESRGLVRTP
ncbi:hypothetical protein G6F35_008859 [Rhizopus arrhizus]|nr:hypothetical protein G6F35_008859 [Rhizopus arrhizus]KAG1248123.1 hypothetical protein G6F65_019791 [Rhizopus arrhizus]